MIKKVLVLIFPLLLFLPFIFFSLPPDLIVKAQDIGNTTATSVSDKTDTPLTVLPKDENLEGVVSQVISEKQFKLDQTEKETQLYQKLSILITKGSLKDQYITVENGNIATINTPKYRQGDKVIVNYSKDIEGRDNFYIADYIRRSPLWTLLSIFIILTVVIGGWRGALSLLGMVISFFIIFSFILPKLLAGNNPVETAILGSALIIPVTFFLSHGFNKKTLVAILGTIISLAITGVIAIYFVDVTKLTGFASEEAGFLQSELSITLNMKGLLLAGIIIGVLGVLDDITVSQAAIVQEIKNTDPSLSPAKLFAKAMTVGKDHIASMVNTLILVYTGAALPLLLLFINNPHPFSEIVNYEIIADEIVRTLVGSIGLILAVPITTLVAAISAGKQKF